VLVGAVCRDLEKQSDMSHLAAVIGTPTRPTMREAGGGQGRAIIASLALTRQALGAGRGHSKPNQAR
jgi:hypothetical protein